ncbi:hypothetical protein BLOT_000046 [Blomia tropicalis]|nr:hypothetical protein BLOT_000046 [Blomia tropicalis]
MTLIVKEEVPILLDLRKLRDESKFTDVILCLSDGKEIPSHKAILGCRSSAFEAMFSHDKMSENQDNRVKIDDISSEIMEIILNFVYGKDINVKMEYARDIITAADKYDLKPLIKLCIETMIEHLEVENAAEIFYLADLHSLDMLKDIVISFINNNSFDVMNSEGWTKFISKNVHLLYYNSLSLELANSTTPVKIKSFTAKISGESTYISNCRYSGEVTFPGSVRQLFPEISGLCKKDPQSFEEIKHNNVQLCEFAKHCTSIKIICNVIFYNGTSKVMEKVTVKEEVPILSDLRKLREESKLTDVTLCLSDGKEIPSHKTILGCRSSVFEAMFSHGKMLENQDNRVKIDDISSEIMEIILNFK